MRLPSTRVLARFLALVVLPGLCMPGHAGAQPAPSVGASGDAPRGTAIDVGATSLSTSGLPQGAPTGAPSSARLAEAKKFFDAGLKLYRGQLYQEALASFVEAYRLAPRESTARNIAQTLRDLKDLASAHNAYEEMLNRFGSTMKSATRGDTERAIEELAVLTGLVHVKVQDAGAKVLVDGKEVGSAPIPKPIRLNLGEHRVLVTRAGFEPLEKTFSVHGHDDFTLEGPLTPEITTGHVHVVTSPVDPTAQVTIDKTTTAPVPWDGDLSPGPHTFEAKGNAGLSASQTVDLARKAQVNVSLELVAQTGTVGIDATPAEAKITFDGAEVATGAWQGTAAVGRHEIVVSAEGYLPAKRVFLVRPGEEHSEHIGLVATKASDAPSAGHGLYSMVRVLGLFPPTRPSNDIAQGRNLAATTAIKGSSGFGAGLDVHVGYSFGFLGLEGSVMGSYDHSSADVAYAPGESTAVHPGVTPRLETYEFHRFGGAADFSVRVMPKVDLVRPTFGVGGGVAFKGGIYRRTAQVNGLTSNAYVSGVGTYVAPNLVFDAGLEIGSVPSARFYVGILAMLEFPNGALASPATPVLSQPPVAGPVDLANGTEFFLGPVIGVRFGE